MGRRINLEWIKDRKEEVRTNSFVTVTTGYNPAAQWLIAYLDFNEIPIKVVNLGAGVKKIIVAKNTCPHCGGKGYVKDA